MVLKSSSGRLTDRGMLPFLRRKTFTLEKLSDSGSEDIEDDDFARDGRSKATIQVSGDAQEKAKLHTFDEKNGSRTQYGHMNYWDEPGPFIVRPYLACVNRRPIGPQLYV